MHQKVHLYANKGSVVEEDCGEVSLDINNSSFENVQEMYCANEHRKAFNTFVRPPKKEHNSSGELEE